MVEHDEGDGLVSVLASPPQHLCATSAAEIKGLIPIIWVQDVEGHFPGIDPLVFFSPSAGVKWCPKSSPLPGREYLLGAGDVSAPKTLVSSHPGLVELL